MLSNNDIETEIKKRGANLIHFVDISHLPIDHSKQFSSALLIGISLSADYLYKVSQTSNYVKQMKEDKQVHNDEFHIKEKEVDGLADFTSNFLEMHGYSALSQSEDNLYLNGFYNPKTKSTPLPHKTIALMAGLGWIGKNNLLVSSQYGSALCISTVLTNAPFKTEKHQPEHPQCGSCTICFDQCSVGALKNKNWEINSPRDIRIDVSKCDLCFKCLVMCPFTQKYIKSNNSTD